MNHAVSQHCTVINMYENAYAEATTPLCQNVYCIVNWLVIVHYFNSYLPARPEFYQVGSRRLSTCFNVFSTQSWCPGTHYILMMFVMHYLCLKLDNCGLI